MKSFDIILFWSSSEHTELGLCGIWVNIIILLYYTNVVTTVGSIGRPSEGNFVYTRGNTQAYNNNYSKCQRQKPKCKSWLVRVLIYIRIIILYVHIRVLWKAEGWISRKCIQKYCYYHYCYHFVREKRRYNEGGKKKTKKLQRMRNEL